MAKRQKLPGQLKPRKKRGSTTLLGRIFIVLLSVLLGMAIVIGAEAAILYGLFGWVTLNRVEDNFGVSLGDGLLTDDSVLRELTVLGMLSEFVELSGKLSEFTPNSLFDYYGIMLPEALKELVPEPVLEISLSDMMGPNAAHVILECITMGDVLSLAGSGLVPDGIYEKIKDRPASLLLSGDIGAIFEDVYAGDLLDIPVEKDSEGVVRPVLGEGEEPHLMSYLATIDIGEYFGAEDRNAVLQKTLNGIPAEVLVEGQEDNLIMRALAGKSLGDIVKAVDGGVYFDTDAMIDSLYLGDALGYTKGEDGNFYDDAGNPPSALLSELVGITVLELPNSDVMGIIDDMYVYELMEYEKQDTGEVDENGDPVYEYVKKENDVVVDTMDGLVSEFAVLKVGDLRDDDALNTQIQSIKLGTAMGYTYDADRDVWVKNGESATGIMRPLLGATIANVDSRIDELYLGEVLGFDNVAEEGETPVFKKDVDGDGDYDDDNSVPDSLMSYFVDMKLADVNEGDAFTQRVQSVQAGHAMGYTQNEYGVWEKDGKLATGVMRPVLSSTISTMDSRLDSLYLGELMGFDNVAEEGETPVFKKDADGDGEYDDDNQVPSPLMASFVDIKLVDIGKESAFTERIQNVKVGHAMGYVEDGGAWYKEAGGEKVTGIFATVSGYKVSEMEEAVQHLQVSDALGYEYDGSRWVKKEAGQPDKYATGLLGVVMESTLDTLSEDVRDVTLGEIMGYSLYDKDSGELADENTPKANIVYRRENGHGGYVEPTGVTAEFVGLTFAELENDATITNKINGLTVGAAMSYTQVGDSWYDANGNEVENTVLLSVIDNKISEMDGALNEMTLADAMGYKRNDPDDGSWYEADGTTKVTSALIISMADTPISGMSAKMNGLTLGEAMGYDKRSGVWYESTVSNTVVGNTGYLSIIGLDTQMSGLNAKLNSLDSLTVGQLVDAGLLTFTTNQITYLNGYFGVDDNGVGLWRGTSLTTFFSTIIPAP